MMVARAYQGDLQAVSKHLQWPLTKVQAAANYADAFPAEIQAALAENDSMDFDSLKRMLPQAEEFIVGKRRRH